MKGGTLYGRNLSLPRSFPVCQLIFFYSYNVTITFSYGSF